jgi:hypothetical protein
MKLKPMGKKGTIGIGINYSYTFGTLIDTPMGSAGYNILYTNSYVFNGGKLLYSPAIIVAQTPISFTVGKGQSTATNDAMFILANSFTYRLTKRFTFNFGYTGIKSTNPLRPLISSFTIGSKLPF